MKQVKLLKTVQIPDETHEGDTPAPTATNYANAILSLGDELADRLIAEGAAELHGETASVEVPLGKTGDAIARTFGGLGE